MVGVEKDLRNLDVVNWKTRHKFGMAGERFKANQDPKRVVVSMMISNICNTYFQLSFLHPALLFLLQFKCIHYSRLYLFARILTPIISYSVLVDPDLHTLQSWSTSTFKTKIKLASSQSNPRLNYRNVSIYIHKWSLPCRGLRLT
jgi:hypothetical protein